ncbi:DUF5008 domain-containing protein [Sphingobacterium pedocola]|uniref:DUF5008 domain-containing protein n=1 Tax=Sphingobacterium pedocola TaxID=2082722 RepID=A0ABR9T9P1_9SPHI|nr:DUF5008 domain-containing protein [Sphingobacterium pedocola]MBE8721819.1 hypothetical protein [Sphingobacterium pedocola]
MKNGIIKYIVVTLSLSLLTTGCRKEATFFSEPYGPGKETLGVVFDRSLVPSPASGGVGTIVKLKVSGLSEYREKAIVKFSGQAAEIVSLDGEELQVKVPLYASTGIMSITIDDVIIFGPEFEVDGRIKIDPTWEARQGTNNSVNDRFVTQDGKVIYIGNFTDYDRRGLVRPINRLVRTYSNGTYDVSWRTGLGANGALVTITQIGDRYYIGGSFSGYDMKRENISNLTSLHLTGGLDSVGIKPYRRPDQSDTTKYVPRFNGGFNAAVLRLYPQDNKLIATGHFRYYVSRQYDKPNARETRDTTILDSIEIRQIARLNLDGSLDKTFRFNGDTPFQGANGDVSTITHESGPHQGKILVFGQFTRFDDKTVGYITRLNLDGTIDNTFNAQGVGADYVVTNVTYNAETNKYIALGQFTTYNGRPARHMALLNADGTLDESFQAKIFLGGFPSYAKQLNDGLIMVSGRFLTYGGVTRNGFMMINPDGNLAETTLNATGQFLGSVYQAYETTSEDGKRALLLMGEFWKFDNKDVSNIIRVTIE